MTLLLSEITLDLTHRGTATADAGDHHRMLMKALDHALGGKVLNSPRQEAGLLFRDEQTSQGRRLLVQSRFPLDPAALGRGYRLTAQREIGQVLDHLRKGQLVRYRLVGSPVKRLGKTNQRRELFRENGERLSSKEHTRTLRGAEAETWWERKAQANGLTLNSVHSTETGDIVDGKRRIRHPAVRFDGLAVIDDVEAVSEAIINGVGRGKVFGLGLLSLAPGK